MKTSLFIILIGLSMPLPAQLIFERNDYIKQDSVQINDSEQLDALFGSSLTAADNLLVIGAPRESSAGEKGGAVYYLFGNNQNGLAPNSPNRRISQNSAGVVGVVEDNDFFGAELVIGNFAGRNYGVCDGVDCDGWRDVIVGVPNETVNGDVSAGMVNILDRGNPDCTEIISDCDALDAIHQDTSGISGATNPGDQFGSAMAVGDFNDDGADDLAIGIPGEDLPNINDATNGGSIQVVMGDSDNLTDFWAEGLTAFWDEIYSQQNLTGDARDDERFGSALAAGDFNNDGQDDLVVGVPFDVQTNGIGSSDNVTGGSINLLYGLPYSPGTVGGLTITGNRHFNQDSDDLITPAMLGNSEEGDKFGAALAVGDFDNDGYDDLAIGIPGEDVLNNTVVDAGAIAIMYGSPQNISGLADLTGGLNTAGNQLLFQGNDGINGTAETNDRFGSVLAVGDMNSDGVDDLIVGNYQEDVNGVEDAGTVAIIYGLENVGLHGANNDIQFNQATLSNPGVLTENFQFGYSLAVGDFDCDGKDDLAIGSRGFNGSLFDPVYYHGAVTILYQKEHDLISKLPMEDVDWGDCVPL